MHRGRPPPWQCYREWPSHVLDIMAHMNPDQIAELIRAGLPGADVLVQSEDNTHFAARVIAAEFAGKRPLARHQLIYRTLGELMGREIHAMSIEALTPEEWQARA
jgi:acid stress-induced BolA-like protein IbaG/YrbA